jgi:dinuclear metal center YbgI/SA1388 family protein
MIPTVQDILNLLDDMAPFSIAEEWDNPGLQVGSLSQEVKRILVALDPTVQAVRNASARSAQLLFTHHPLIFKPLSCISRDAYPGDVVKEALEKDVSVLAAHTNLDASRGGINDILADLFGIQDTEVLSEIEDSHNHEVGMGRIGFISRPAPFSAVIETVKSALGVDKLMVMGSQDKEIRKIAVVGGAGGSMVPVASRKGADLLITGEIKHHEALLAQTMNLALIDGGHFHIEKKAMTLFADMLRDRLKEYQWDVFVEVCEEEQVPMRYYE